MIKNWLGKAEIKAVKKLERTKEKENKLLKQRRKQKHFVKFLDYAKRAYLKKYAFYLVPDDFKRIDLEPCFYCGDIASGFDKIEPKHGYIKSNIVVCCKNCNFMKYTNSIEDFLKHVEKIHNFQQKKHEN